MTSKQKDNLSLERAYLTIIESAEKCPECGCNPSSPKEGCECEHHNEVTEEETVAEDKNKKPEWLIKAQKKAEGEDVEDEDEDEDSKKTSDKKEVKESLEQIYAQIINESKK